MSKLGACIKHDYQVINNKTRLKRDKEVYLTTETEVDNHVGQDERTGRFNSRDSKCRRGTSSL